MNDNQNRELQKERLENRDSIYKETILRKINNCNMRPEGLREKTGKIKYKGKYNKLKI